MKHIDKVEMGFHGTAHPWDVVRLSLTETLYVLASILYAFTGFSSIC